MMEKLFYDQSDRLNTQNLVRIGDLSFYEGPLLSLFEELSTGNFYLFDWVDRDDKSNRWLIYKVFPKDLLAFINGKISHLELFNNRPKQSVYFVDIDVANKHFSEYKAFALSIVPQIYLPNEDNYFDVLDCNAFDKIKSVVINELSRQKNEYIFPKIRIRKQTNKEAYYGHRVVDSKLEISDAPFLNTLKNREYAS